MNKKQYILSLVAILFITMLIVSSSTFAFFQWSSDSASRTSVNFTLDIDGEDGNEGIRMYIDNPEGTEAGMYPTASCASAGASSFVSSVRIVNNTGTYAAPNFKLKVRIKDSAGNVITNTKSAMDQQNNTNNPYRYYIRYAVTEENGDCTQPLYSGRFNVNTQTVSGSSDWYDSGLITLSDSTTGFPKINNGVNGGVTFLAFPYETTLHNYKIWFWIDGAYTTTVVGNNISTDKMQNANITVSFSQNSTVEQVRND